MYFVVQNELNIKKIKQFIVSDSLGIERYDQIIDEIPPKKKIAFIKSRWRKVIGVKEALHEPQFIFINSSLRFYSY
jgi:hypothetical protein